MNKNLLPAIFLLFSLSGEVYAQKVFLNPSDQYDNPVAGGGNEAEFALINAQLTKEILTANGFFVKLDQDFYNAPKNANSWGADIYISIHSNAGGGHGTETLYISSGGKLLASHIQNGLLSKLPYQDRGLKFRDDLYVLKATNMFAVLTEVVFHDCSKVSGYKGHPPSESSFLKSAEGQQEISEGIAAGVCSYYGKDCGFDIQPLEKGWLKGVVYKYPDLADRIEGAVVELNTGESVVSSKTGYWEFELTPGTYTATAKKPGFYSNFTIRTVEAGKEVWGSIGLTPLPQGFDESLSGADDAYKKEIFEATEFAEEEIAEGIQPVELGYPDPQKTEIKEDLAADIVETKGDLCDSSNCTKKSSSGGGCSIHSRADSSRSPPFSILLLVFLAVISLNKFRCCLLK